MKNNIKYIAGSFVWSTVAKLLNAGLRFISIPLLINYFGKNNYGLITLAISANAYLQLLNMGMNTGAVKFFSQWIANNEYDRINRVSRTNITFYASLGVINSIVLLILAWKGLGVFNISQSDFYTFRSLLYILAGVSIINWTTFVFNQLLVADEKFAFTQQVLSIRNILNLAIVLFTIYYKWSIFQYFLYDSFINMLVIIPYFYVSKHRGLIKSFLPAFYWKDFFVIFKYSSAIFVMSIFQFTATQSRPLILGIFSNQGTSILADYRVIEVFPLFIISIGGMMISIFLPKTSQAILRNDRNTIEKMAYEGTKYTSILVSLLSFPIILISKELLTLYVGESYAHLSIWLSLWVFTLTLFLHNTPVASLTLATGKTRVLVYSSAIACIISVIINISLTNILGVGSAVVGFLTYIIIQISFYYFYFNTKILKLNSLIIFRSFFIPTIIGLLVTVIISVIKFNIDRLFVVIIIKILIWTLLYFTLLVMFKTISLSEIQSLFNRISKK